MIDNDIIRVMSACFSELDFEVRKELTAVVCRCIVHDHAGFATTYLPLRTREVASMLQHYKSEDAGLLAGQVVREVVLASPALHLAVLTAEPHHAEFMPLNEHVVQLLHEHVNAQSFNIAADALQTVTALLTTNCGTMREFLTAHHAAFFNAFSTMLMSKRYPTRLEGLKLLSELLLDKDNFEIMVEFVRNRQYMRSIMTLMRDKHTSVQFEAFHVFKLFAANPDKPEAIQHILLANRDKLVQFMRSLCNDRDDADFLRERALIIETLLGMEGDVPASPSASVEGTPDAAAAQGAAVTGSTPPAPPAAAAAAAAAAAGSGGVPASSPSATSEVPAEAAEPAAAGTSAPAPEKSDAGTSSSAS